MKPVDPNVLEIGTVVESRWQVKQVLGTGSFGAVYEVMDFVLNVEQAMKVELNSQDFRTLKMEVIVLKELTDIKARNCCQLYGLGSNESYSFIVMTEVGPSLMSLLESIGGNNPHKKKYFSLRSCLHLAINCLQALEDLHFIGYLHRDIKPQNYAIGREPNFRSVYMLDFGMCRKYIRDDGTHKRARLNSCFRGTLYFASHLSLKGEEQSRRDDVWSWLFTIIYMMTGTLPWNDVKLTRKMSFLERRNAFGESKQKIMENPDPLMAGLPIEFRAIIEHLNLLGYTDCPNYAYICQLLMTVFRRNDFNLAMPLDWEPQGELHQMTMAAPAHNMMPHVTSESKKDT
ncbi:putative serine/threonine-protein kinase [Trichinella pseudospiralis]|uniref:Putative serine/threonine-protein kinase n=1 Tax=Trichinella pseudospiralis TaxID=6337 RepID=A0A0V0YCU4_TRIPS|nr:putative serine/threonine-protein kinase [Trichinella pseudospiralis]